jgi:hypothetical protein
MGIKKRQTVLIACRRDPEAVADSMIRRGNGDSRDFIRFVSLAQAYTGALARLRPDVWVGYEELVATPRAVADRLENVLEYPIQDLSHIDPLLDHSHGV